MKVNIGPYPYDLIPVRKWETRYEMFRSKTHAFLDEDEYTWYDKIVFGFFDKLTDLVWPINSWARNRKRKVKVHIDGYDVWSADHTIALVIYPLLLKLKEIKHGSCPVDFEDVPEQFHPTEEAGPDNGYTDNTIHDRWEWVLNEIIWAFEQCTHPDNNDAQFYHNSDQLGMVFNKTDDAGYSTIGFDYQKDPSKPKYWVDEKGRKDHYKRINNGLRLFAKYYFGLWD